MNLIFGLLCSFNYSEFFCLIETKTFYYSLLSGFYLLIWFWAVEIVLSGWFANAKCFSLYYLGNRTLVLFHSFFQIVFCLMFITWILSACYTKHSGVRINFLRYFLTFLDSHDRINMSWWPAKKKKKKNRDTKLQRPLFIYIYNLLFFLFVSLDWLFFSFFFSCFSPNLIFFTFSFNHSVTW